MRYLEKKDGDTITLPAYGTLPETHHVFDQNSVEAVNAALASGRPLLVRGEPGTGKSQLARAAAAELGRAYLPFTVDARTEARDLLYSVDTVARLAEAQILGHQPQAGSGDIRQTLAETRFTTPGPLWWVFQWNKAAQQAAVAGSSPPKPPEGWQEADGAVLLIDEIDKADAAVPNGLLEALGQGEFKVPGGATVAWQGGTVPLVILTTNEERALPDAFVRRCLVLHLFWDKDETKLVEALKARGRAHFKKKQVADDILQRAAELLAVDRKEVADRGLCPPGGAEYLDLLRVVATRWPGDETAQREALDRIKAFALQKHPKEDPW